MSESTTIRATLPSSKKKQVASKKANYRFWMLILGVLLLTLLLPWLWKNYLFPKETIYLAIAGPLTDSNGQAMLQGVELAISQVNHAGGIHGHPLKLLPFDDKNDPTLAKEKAKAIVDSQAIVVIGHYTSGASLAAAEIYKEQRIPAISGSATADRLTKENDGYFRVMFNNSDQGALLAYYVYNILGHDQASILFDEDEYGSNLKEAFVTTAKTIGLKIQEQWHFNADSFEQTLAEMTDTLRADKHQEKSARPMLFLATHSTEAAKTLIHLKHQQVGEVPIIGSEALSSKNFNDLLKNELREQYQPGYYTNGIYLVMPFIPDLAGKRAIDFSNAFKKHFSEDKSPSTTAVFYYDATQVVIEALKKMSLDALSLSKKRQQLQANLWTFSDQAHSVHGVTGEIYFDRHGDVDKPITIGAILEQGKPTVAWSQYWSRTWNVPKMTPSILDATLSDVFADRLLKINGKFRRKTDIVYVGFEFNDIKQLNTKEMTYMLDFYIWFRFQPNENRSHCRENASDCQQDRFSGDVIEFVNIVNQKDGILVKPENIYTNYSFINKKEGAKDSITEIYRVKALFKGNFDFRAFPLDHQTLLLQLRDRKKTRGEVIFAVDAQGMRSDTFVDKIKNSDVFSVHGWQVDDMSFFEDTQEVGSTFGATQFFHSQHQLDFSRLNAEIEIKRHILSFFLKNLFPTVLLIVLGYGMFFVKTFPTQVGLGVNLILPTSILHIRLSSELPTLPYFTLLEYVLYLIYFLAVFSLALAVLMHVYEESNVRVAQINLLGKISYPLIVLLSIVIIYYYYSGVYV